MQQYKYVSYGYIALRDLMSAKKSVQALPSVSGCYSQQAVEKMIKHYLKEVLASDSEDAMGTHKISKLIRASGLKFPDDIGSTLRDLTDVYLDTRYPGDEYWELDTATALQYYNAAEKAVVLIDARIKEFRERDKSVYSVPWIHLE